MAVVINSLKKKKLPKAPKMNASKSAWDNYAKRKKEVEAYNRGIETERKRREKLKTK